jgi:hypothetical protein
VELQLFEKMLFDGDVYCEHMIYLELVILVLEGKDSPPSVV